MKTINNYASLVKEKHALNKTIAPVETDLTDASQAYAIGQNFIYDGVLYKAKTAIAQHDALVLNTNYEAADDIVSQIAGKQDPITVDNVPTENSNNLVKSGGVFSAEANIYEVMGKNGAKNLSKPINSTTYNGITVVCDSDGVLTVTGTASASGGRLNITGDTFTLKAGTYKVVQNSDDLTKYASIVCHRKSDNTALGYVLIENGTINNTNAQFTLAADTECFLGMNTYQGTDYGTGAGTKEYVMVVLADDTDTTYQPYAKTNQQLTAENQTLTQKAYLTDDATETALASDDVVPFYDTSATAKKKMTVQNLAGQLISNPNLLDNPWFTVNQRGFENQSFSSANFYTFDRWRAYKSSGSTQTLAVSYSDEILTLTHNDVAEGAGFQQLFEIDRALAWHLEGKTITLSVKLADDSIVSATAQMPSSIPSQGTNIVSIPIGTDFHCSFYVRNATSMFVTFYSDVADATASFKAVKLELGSVSTLAMDTAPNYATELLKCQRYFIRYSTETANSSIGFFRGFTADAVVGDVILPTFMRAKPTVTVNDLTYFRFEGYTNGSTENLVPSSITLLGSSGNVCKLKGVPTTNAVSEKVYSLKFVNILGTLDFSADL